MEQRGGGIGMDLSRQLTINLSGVLDFPALNNSLIHRMPRQQSICRRSHRAFVCRTGDAGKRPVIAPNMQHHLARLVAQSASQEQIIGCNRFKATANTPVGGQNRVLLAKQGTKLALRKQGTAIFQ